MFDPPRSTRLSTTTPRPRRTAAIVWSLLNLELWYRTFIDGDGVQTLGARAARLTAGRRAAPHARSTAAPIGVRAPMRILWLNAGLLLPLDKGGKLRTWHLMRHLARRHEITYLSFARCRRSRRGRRRACARSCSTRRDRPARRDPARARCASTPTRRGTSLDPLPVRRRQVPLGALPRARSRRCSTTARFDARRLRLPACRPSTCRSGCRARRSSSRTTSRRRSGGGTPRPRPGALRACAAARSSGGACCGSKGGRSRRFDRVLAVSEADARHVRARSIRTPSRPGARRADRRRHRATSRRSPRRRRPRAPRLHRLDGLAAERGRDASTSAARSCRSSAPAEPRRHASHRRPRADAGRPAARADDARRRGHRPRGRRPAVHRGRGASTSCRCASAAARG